VCTAKLGNAKIASCHSNAVLPELNRLLLYFFEINVMQLILTLLYDSLNLVVSQIQLWARDAFNGGGAFGNAIGAPLADVDHILAAKFSDICFYKFCYFYDIRNHKICYSFWRTLSLRPHTDRGSVPGLHWGTFILQIPWPWPLFLNSKYATAPGCWCAITQEK